MDLEQDLDKLRHQESFQNVVEEIRQQHADRIRDLADVESDKIERVIGEVAAYQWVLDLFQGI